MTACPSNPVEEVSWDDVQRFIAKLNQLHDGYTYRLPTEAEWEFAARAGTSTAYYFGSNSDDSNSYAWTSANSNQQTHEVGTLHPNPWGLYDMTGNVGQWVEDYYGDFSSKSAADPINLSPASNVRVFRGGSYRIDPQYLRMAVRSDAYSTYLYPELGFRLVRTKTE